MALCTSLSLRSEGQSLVRRYGRQASTLKEWKHENVTRNRACRSSADDRHRNRGPDFEHRHRGRKQTRQVVRGGRVCPPIRSPTVRNAKFRSYRPASWALSRNRHASQSLNRRGQLAVLRLWRSAMRRRMTNWVNYDPWVIGVLEPILLLLCIALIGAVLGLL